MKDVPQPAPEPYSPGDQVRIYLDPADLDAYAQSTDREIIDVRPTISIPKQADPTDA